MSKTIKILLVLFLIGIICAIAVWKYVFIKADVTVGSKKADVSIEASALLKKFEMNEDSANSLYLNKVLLVTGTVDNLTRNDQGVSVYLKNKEDAAGVMCGFDMTAIDTTVIKPGIKINVKGVCSGYNIDDVGLSKCSLVK
jgi:hypothetical protein